MKRIAKTNTSILGILLALVLLASHQSCSQRGDDVQFSSIDITYQGGTGEGFDGKPRPGDWNRSYPEYSCPNAQDLVQATITMGSTTGNLISDNCVPTPIIISKFDPEINFRFYNPDYFIFSGSIFEIYNASVPAHVNEALCRVQIAGTGLDAIIKSQPNGSRTATVVTGSYTTREIKSLDYTNILKAETDTELKFTNSDNTLTLSIRGNPSSYKNLDGILQVSLNGEPKEFSMTCQKMSKTSVLESIATNSSTLYVDRQKGTDANNGLSETSAFYSVARCASTVKPGDTCVVKNGTYTEDILFRTSGTSTGRITFKNFANHRPILDFVGTTGAARFEILSPNYNSTPMSHITIEGFEVANGKANAIKFNFGTELVFKNNHFRDSRACLAGSGYRVRIENNRFTRCGISDNTSGIQIHGQQNVVINNILEQSGIGIYGGAYPFSAVFPDPLYFDFRDNVIAHNTIAYSSRHAITLWAQDGGKVINNRVSNNILYENCRSCPDGSVQGVRYWSPNGSGDQITNNLFFATGGGTVPIGGGGQFQPATQYSESANLFNVQNPLFINAPATLPQSPNYHLQSGSPAIDQGVNLINIAPQDFDGNSRPRGAGVDLGAFEF